MSNVNPNWSADCHASGAAPYIATAVREDSMIKWCGHCLAAPRPGELTHLDQLIIQGWTIYPLQRAIVTPAGWFDKPGTEGTPRHFALDNF